MNHFIFNLFAVGTRYEPKIEMADTGCVVIIVLEVIFQILLTLAALKFLYVGWPTVVFANVIYGTIIGVLVYGTVAQATTWLWAWVAISIVIIVLLIILTGILIRGEMKETTRALDSGLGRLAVIVYVVLAVVHCLSRIVYITFVIMYIYHLREKGHPASGHFLP